MVEPVLLGKLAIGAGCGVLSVVVARRPAVRSLDRSRFDALLLGWMLLSRLGVFVGLFVVLGIDGERSDMGYYVAEGRAILDGAVLYRDVETSYAPLFPYACAGILWIWESFRAIILAAILLEIGSIPLWLGAARRRLDEDVVRLGAVLYATSPVPLVNVAINGQNQVWLAFLLALAVRLLARRDVLSGVALGLSLAAVKVLGLLFAPVLWLFARRRLLWLSGFVLPPLATYLACFLLLGLTVEEVLVPLEVQGLHVTAGNLPWLTSALGVDLDDAFVLRLFTLLTMAALATVFLAAWARGAPAHRANLFHLLALVLLTVFLFSKKAYPSYLVLAFFPLCLSIAARPPSLRTLLVFAVLGVLAVLEPSLLFRWLAKEGPHAFHDLRLLWQPALPDGVERWQVAAFAAVDAVLVATYAYFFVRAWKGLRGGLRLGA